MIQDAKSTRHLRQTAYLRAEAYYEAQPAGRFTESFKRQFAEQELSSLMVRTSNTLRPLGPGSRQPCLCLVAVEAASGDVVGCVDVRPPKQVTGCLPKGVPNDDLAAYMLNVVVAEDSRERGLGTQLIGAACKVVVDRWGGQRMFTHVDAQNDVACRLYSRCGFEPCAAGETEAEGVAGTTLGKQIWMMLDLSRSPDA